MIIRVLHASKPALMHPGGLSGLVLRGQSSTLATVCRRQASISDSSKCSPGLETSIIATASPGSDSMARAETLSYSSVGQSQRPS